MSEIGEPQREWHVHPVEWPQAVPALPEPEPVAVPEPVEVEAV
jgi:hypothetical protein